MSAGRDKDLETPTLEQLMKIAIEDAMSKVFTYLPAQVVKYDKAKQMADVLICVQKKYTTGDIKQYPILTEVPVEFLRAGKASFIVPVKAGTYGSVKVSARSIEKWKKAGGCPDPNDTRKFNLSDSVFFPGLNPFSDPADIDEEKAITMQNDKAVIELFEGGTFKFRKRGGDEILDLLVLLADRLHEVAAQLEIATTNTLFGPLQLNNFAMFATIKTQVQGYKDRLDALREP